MGMMGAAGSLLQLEDQTRTNRATWTWPGGREPWAWFPEDVPNEDPGPDLPEEHQRRNNPRSSSIPPKHSFQHQGSFPSSFLQHHEQHSKAYLDQHHSTGASGASHHDVRAYLERQYQKYGRTGVAAIGIGSDFHAPRSGLKIPPLRLAPGLHLTEAQRAKLSLHLTGVGFANEVGDQRRDDHGTGGFPASSGEQAGHQFGGQDQRGGGHQSHNQGGQDQHQMGRGGHDERGATVEERGAALEQADVVTTDGSMGVFPPTPASTLGYEPATSPTNPTSSSALQVPTEPHNQTVPNNRTESVRANQTTEPNRSTDAAPPSSYKGTTTVQVDVSDVPEGDHGLKDGFLEGDHGVDSSTPRTATAAARRGREPWQAGTTGAASPEPSSDGASVEGVFQRDSNKKKVPPPGPNVYKMAEKQMAAMVEQAEIMLQSETFDRAVMKNVGQMAVELAGAIAAALRERKAKGSSEESGADESTEKSAENKPPESAEKSAEGRPEESAEESAEIDESSTLEVITLERKLDVGAEGQMDDESSKRESWIPRKGKGKGPISSERPEEDSSEPQTLNDVDGEKTDSSMLERERWIPRKGKRPISSESPEDRSEESEESSSDSSMLEHRWLPRKGKGKAISALKIELNTTSPASGDEQHELQSPANSTSSAEQEQESAEDPGHVELLELDQSQNKSRKKSGHFQELDQSQEGIDEEVVPGSSSASALDHSPSSMLERRWLPRKGKGKAISALKTELNTTSPASREPLSDATVGQSEELDPADEQPPPREEPESDNPAVSGKRLSVSREESGAPEHIELLEITGPSVSEENAESSMLERWLPRKGKGKAISALKTELNTTSPATSTEPVPPQPVSGEEQSAEAAAGFQHVELLEIGRPPPVSKGNDAPALDVPPISQESSSMLERRWLPRKGKGKAVSALKTEVNATSPASGELQSEQHELQSPANSTSAQQEPESARRTGEEIGHVELLEIDQSEESEEQVSGEESGSPEHIELLEIDKGRMYKPYP